jgi:hypothetical protein|tara:strand:- start:845 stop:1186 length:342 start_codon:yes stop_codon:yes gene_type:complete
MNDENFYKIYNRYCCNIKVSTFSTVSTVSSGMKVSRPEKNQERKVRHFPQTPKRGKNNDFGFRRFSENEKLGISSTLEVSKKPLLFTHISTVQHLMNSLRKSVRKRVIGFDML